ncbi:MAG: hypothetical protein KDC12_00710 [Flavobacteriales bacterium]|nr:hypothetical protein [Flavobacteriales bacterium]
MNKLYFLGAFLCVILASGCQMKEESTTHQSDHPITLQGHRGCRGEMPENTIPAFLRAIDAGVSTLELDVVLSSDGELIVSHEPWMNMQIVVHPDGSPIGKEEQFVLNLFEMTTEEIQSYPCGTLRHPKYPDQTRVTTHKPTLSEVVAAVRDHCKKKNKPVPFFNIEIKSTLKGDGVYHPTPEVYAKAFLRKYLTLSISNYTTIQSFDYRLLNQLHAVLPEAKLVFLSEKKEPLEAQLKKLNFSPYGVSLESHLWDASTAHSPAVDGMIKTAWTVNDEAEMFRLIDLGVYDIITDYPTIMLKALNGKGMSVVKNGEQE